MTIETKQTQAMVMRDESRAFEPSDLATAVQIATMAATSKIFKGIGSPEAAFVVIATGRELGLTAMQSLRGIHMIEGRPSISADAAQAVILRHPTCAFFRLVESTDKIATYETQRKGDGVQRMSFTIEQAANAKLTGKDNWKYYPAAMLRSRCSLALARAIFPDALMGVCDPDEVGDRAAIETTGVPVEAKSATAVATVVGEPAADLEAGLAVRIEKASTVPLLARVGVAIQKSALGAEAMSRLREAYTARKMALQQPQPMTAPAADAATGEVAGGWTPEDEAAAHA